MEDFIGVTKSGRYAINAARNMAKMLGHNNIGAEHLLLGVLADPGAAASVLQGITLDAAREVIISIEGRGSDDTNVEELVYAPSYKRILAQSADEARALEQDAVSVEHILLALMREREDIAATVLRKLGLDLDKAREELLHALETEAPSPSPENGGHAMPDWKQPLYAYAIEREGGWSFSKMKELEEIYTLLGGYQDANEHLKGVLSKVQGEYEKEANAVNCSDNISVVEHALQNLRNMDGYGDSAALIAKGEERLHMLRERERMEQENRERAGKRRKRMQWLLMTATLVVAVAALVVYHLIVLPGYVRKGDELLENRQYAEAVASYEKAGREDKTVEAQTEWGKALRAALDYEGAIEHFREAGEESYVNEAIRAWGQQLLDEGEYEAAVEKLSEQDLKDSLYDAYRAWSDHLAETESAAAAIEMLYHIPESPDREARIAELQLQQADESLALLKEHDQNGEKDNDYARGLGEPISDLNAQLKYCRGLAEAGYSLTSVYPDGVHVSNVSLGQYQIDEIQNSNDEAPDIDISRVLLFERIEKPFEDYDEDKPELALRDRHDDSLFDVKLLPGLMFSLIPEAVAESWDDASCIVLLDNVYEQSGTITVETTFMNYTTSITTKDYPFYSAVSCMCAYPKDNPKIGCILAYTIVDPVCADDEWFDLNKSTNTVLEGQYRVAEFDQDLLNDDMRVSLLLLSLYYLYD